MVRSSQENVLMETKRRTRKQAERCSQLKKLLTMQAESAWQNSGGVKLRFFKHFQKGDDVPLGSQIAMPVLAYSKGLNTLRCEWACMTTKHRPRYPQVVATPSPKSHYVQQNHIPSHAYLMLERSQQREVEVFTLSALPSYQSLVDALMSGVPQRGLIGEARRPLQTAARCPDPIWRNQSSTTAEATDSASHLETSVNQSLVELRKRATDENDAHMCDFFEARG
ncbi:hypothetical protein PANDA_008531 [Ailuropoda melanoleuca]|uniref:Uncharacterized protein n=1 Tax=Ailuropoda melanoleuca TaxID=9646 RepID=D2HD18_AILME|nr:hypothetical protein PANDA_008531 [Ailuropoda melanoleuca]